MDERGLHHKQDNYADRRAHAAVATPWASHSPTTRAVIDDIEEAINAPGFGSLPDTVNEKSALADRCKAADGATGACVLTEAGTHVSIGHAIHVVANIEKMVTSVDNCSD